ncbi:MAG: hypothetical protein ACFCA4_08700 [Cyanophyceae cyanobacterium]
MDGQIIEPHQICQSCLMADQRGNPRCHQGRLGCARYRQCDRKLCPSNPQQRSIPSPAEPVECQMGFFLTHMAN